MNLHAAHLPEDTLLRLLDGEGTNLERDDWRQHLTRCERCSAAYEDLQRIVRNLSADMEEIGIPDGFLERTSPERLTAMPTTSVADTHQVRWLQVAAVVTVLVLPLLASEPLRAWVSEWITPGVPVEKVDLPATEDLSSQGEIRFAPAGDELRVEIATRQMSGTLALSRAAGPYAILEAHGGPSGEGVMLSERSVRISNRPASRTNYSLRLPRSIHRVRLRVGGEVWQTVDVDLLERPLSVDLSGEGH